MAPLSPPGSRPRGLCNVSELPDFGTFGQKFPITNLQPHNHIINLKPHKYCLVPTASVARERPCPGEKTATPVALGTPRDGAPSAPSTGKGLGARCQTCRPTPHPGRVSAPCVSILLGSWHLRNVVGRAKLSHSTWNKDRGENYPGGGDTASAGTPRNGWKGSENTSTPRAQTSILGTGSVREPQGALQRHGGGCGTPKPGRTAGDTPHTPQQGPRAGRGPRSRRAPAPAARPLLPPPGPAGTPGRARPGGGRGDRRGGMRGRACSLTGGSPVVLRPFTPAPLHSFTLAPLYSCTPASIYSCIPLFLHPSTPTSPNPYTPASLHPISPPLYSCTPLLPHPYVPLLLHPSTPAPLHPHIPLLLHPCIHLFLRPFTPAPLHSYIPKSLHPCIPSPPHPFIPLLLHPKSLDPFSLASLHRHTPPPLYSHIPLLLHPSTPTSLGPFSPAPLHPHIPTSLYSCTPRGRRQPYPALSTPQGQTELSTSSSQAVQSPGSLTGRVLAAINPQNTPCARPLLSPRRALKGVLVLYPVLGKLRHGAVREGAHGHRRWDGTGPGAAHPASLGVTAGCAP